MSERARVEVDPYESQEAIALAIRRFDGARRVTITENLDTGMLEIEGYLLPPARDLATALPEG